MHQNFAFVETWRGFAVGHGDGDGRWQGICWKRSKSNSIQSLNLRQSCGRAHDLIVPSVWRNVALDFLISLLQTKIHNADDDDDYGDGCHKSKWTVAHALSCTCTWCFWFWNRFISSHLPTSFWLIFQSNRRASWCVTMPAGQAPDQHCTRR